MQTIMLFHQSKQLSAVTDFLLIDKSALLVLLLEGIAALLKEGPFELIFFDFFLD
jgi:hypothetical protein